jgi:predicted SAM-dependent methyltransferase
VKLVNLGCGDCFHPDWVNIDVNPSTSEVIRHDLLRGLPFENASVDGVYSSHLLEHLSKSQAEGLVKEIYRALKPGGIARIVVPDLEGVARSYIDSLEKVRRTNDLHNQENHKWAIIELVDQMVRQESGGEMERYWHQQTLVNEEHIAARVGQLFLRNRSKWLGGIQDYAQQQLSGSSLGRRHSLKLKILQTFFGISRQEFDYLNFRRSGELHNWMYDEISLTRLLQDSGFLEIWRTNPFHGSVPDWEKYKSLDVQDGAVRKPDSLFMEARR